MRRPSLTCRNPIAWRLSALLVLFTLVPTLAACGPETLVVGLEPKTLQRHDSPVQGLAFSPDGALLAAGSRDGTLRVWGVAEGHPADWALLHAREVPTGGNSDGYAYDVAFSPDSTSLAFGLPDGSVRLWRLTRDEEGGSHLRDLQLTPLHTLRVDDSAISSLAFAPDGRTLAAGARRGAVHLWRVSDGVHLQSLHGPTDPAVSVAFSPEGTTLVAASLEPTTTVWDVSSATVIDELKSPSATTGVAFSPDGSLLATAGAADDDLRLWQTEDWSPIRELKPARGGMGNVAFSPDGTMLAAGNARYEVCWWRVADGQLLNAARGHKDSVNRVAFSPDGTRLASGSLDGAVKLWSVVEGAARP